jgi:hypothetical protein
MSDIGSSGPQGEHDATTAAAPTSRAAGLTIIDDNPATLDLLGFDAVVTPVVEVICRDDVRPLTVGIRGGWGTGKSTLLQLIEDSLTRDHNDSFMVVTIDPWEYENSEQFRSTLIEIVLTELQDLVRGDEGLGKKVRRLIGRVRFGKVATSLLKGIATVPLDAGWGLVGQLVQGMTADADSFVAPAEDENALPPTMHGFRAEFAELITALNEAKGIKKVIVLVDDLDRCLPNTVIESLEAIKLFLAVDRMVFVIAADEEMVRSAIAASLAGTGRASAFANLYLEKIVQLPLTIPALTPDDAVTYSTLLLADQADVTASGQLQVHCRTRRAANQLPLLDEAPHSDATRPAEALARQICSGLDADTAINPRRVKRFLNNFAVRCSIAGARGVQLSAPATAKLMLLEERFLDPDFRVLAATPGPDLKALLHSWEGWAKGQTKDMPDGVSEGSRQWAASEPSLADSEENIAAYLTLAAALTASASGGALSGKVAKFADSLIANKDVETVKRELLTKQFPDLDDAEGEQVMLAIAGRATTISPPAHAVRLLVEIIEARPGLAPIGCRIIDTKLAQVVDAGVSAKLATSGIEGIQQLAVKFADDDRVNAMARAAISTAMNPRR